MDNALARRYRFFKAHAPSVTPPGLAACALALARAERAARAAGVDFVYSLDPDPSWAIGVDGAYHAAPAFIVRAVLEDEHEQQHTLAAIGGVEMDAEQAFYVVIEAQLAAAALCDGAIAHV